MSEKAVGCIVITLVVVAAVTIIGLGALTFFPVFHRWNADRVNAIKKPYITQDAHVQVQSYEWFYDMYNQIKATKANINVMKGQPEENSLRLILNNMIGEYNAKAKMTETKAQWKPTDIPFELNAETL